MSKKLIVIGLAVAAVVAFVAGRHPAPDPKVLTPEHARAALVELLRNQPNACGVKCNPDEYATKPLEERGEGRYRLGWFSIDVPRASFQLHLIGNGHAIDCKGAFRCENGAWVARVTESSIGCWK